MDGTAAFLGEAFGRSWFNVPSAVRIAVNELFDFVLDEGRFFMGFLAYGSIDKSGTTS